MVACTNDDIPMGNTVTFKVNPNTVVSPFTYEFSAGELEQIDSDEKLRLRLFVYDNAGNLVNKAEELVSSYTNIVNMPLSLASGNYTIIGTSDVVQPGSKVPEFWGFSGEQQLNTLTITDLGYIGAQAKILGVAKSQVSVSSDTRDVSINLAPAGSVIYVLVRSIHQYSNVTHYGLVCNKTTDALLFDNNGNTLFDVKQQDGMVYVMAKISTGNTGDNIYTMNYIFPMTTAKYQFVYYEGDSFYDLGSEMTINNTTQAGKEYLFSMDMSASDYAISLKDVTGQRRSAPQRVAAARAQDGAAGLPLLKNDPVRVVDLVK
ncbi:MAG: hypothetical protein IJU62_00785 [Muribaculaceae bacterium]|nr:hypothetical protein [Muribaculaceae bacterium]